MNLNKFPIARSGKKLLYHKDLPYDGEDIQPLPYIQDEAQRFAAFISAPSGAGKSYEAARIVKELKKTKKHKSNLPVLVTLSAEEDPAYSEIDMYRLPLNELLDEEPSFYRNTIMVFDDWESGEKQDVKRIHSLIKRVLERGRKQNIAVLVICHQTQNYGLTRDIIFECSTVVLYPVGGLNSIMRFAKAYMDLSPKELQQMRSLISGERLFWFHKAVPRYLATSSIVQPI